LLIVAALRQGCNADHTLEQLKGFYGVWRSTVNRWEHYFRKLFPQHVSYRRLAGHLIPPIPPALLPKALLERFWVNFSEPETALINCLQALAMGP